MDAPGEMLGSIQLALYQSLVEEEFRAFLHKLGPLPGLDRLPHQLEVPLRPVHAERKDTSLRAVLCS